MEETIFDKVKKFYNMHIYKKKHVADFVKKGKLTPEQYELITKEPYTE
ncbi:MAG: XkdX family protein [Lachnospiraceae bacterium]|nr:XkdX family protein [Lachnospiraceae bacterium]